MPIAIRLCIFFLNFRCVNGRLYAIADGGDGVCLFFLVAAVAAVVFYSAKNDKLTLIVGKLF